MGVNVQYRYYHFSRCGPACTSQHLEIGTPRESPRLVGIDGTLHQQKFISHLLIPGYLEFGVCEGRMAERPQDRTGRRVQRGPCEGQRKCTDLGHPPTRKWSSLLVWLRLRAREPLSHNLQERKTLNNCRLKISSQIPREVIEGRKRIKNQCQPSLWF